MWGSLVLIIAAFSASNARMMAEPNAANQTATNQTAPVPTPASQTAAVPTATNQTAANKTSLSQADPSYRLQLQQQATVDGSLIRMMMTADPADTKDPVDAASAVDSVEDAIEQKFDVLENLILKKLENLTAEIRALHVEPKTPKLRLVQNRGTIGASSEYSTGSPMWGKQNAFSTSEKFWSNVDNQFPALIWMRFSAPFRLGKIGYRVAGGGQPKIAEVIGSNDCSTWTTLRYIENTGFSGGAKEFKAWSVPIENSIPFPCIGLRWPFKGTGSCSEIGSITMWEWV